MLRSDPRRVLGSVLDIAISSTRLGDYVPREAERRLYGMEAIYSHFLGAGYIEVSQ